MSDAGVVVGSDGLARTPWAYGDPLLLDYYDNEWGEPVTDESGLFERLTLEGFQSGLSWLIVLRKREAFRSAFAGFDADVVQQFDETTIEELMMDSGIIRNRSKIVSTITNARAVVELRGDGGLAELIWSYTPETTPEPRTMSEVPTVSGESKALAKELKRRGFSFVGPTTAFALMEAIGMVDTHLVESHRRGVSGIWS